MKSLVPTEEVVEMRVVNSAAANASFFLDMYWSKMEMTDDTGIW